MANAALRDALRKRNKATSANALPTSMTANQPPCSYTLLAIAEPNAPPIKMLVLSLIHI